MRKWSDVIVRAKILARREREQGIEVKTSMLREALELILQTNRDLVPFERRCIERAINKLEKLEKYESEVQ